MKQIARLELSIWTITEKNGMIQEGCWKDKPRHDESSHCADAFRTGGDGFVGRIQELSNYDYAPSFATAQDDYLD